jgi:hypothetical protein
VLKSGGVKVSTKNVHDNIHDDLKCDLNVDDVKVEVESKIIDECMIIGSTHAMKKPKGKIKIRMVKEKVTVKKSRLEKVTSHLHDLEDNCGPEKILNIDLGLYQMEDF